LALAFVVLLVFAVLALVLPGAALCLPPGCSPPLAPSWPFKPAGISGVRIGAVFAFFLLAAVLIAIAARRWTRWPTLVVGAPLALVLSATVVGGASPVGQWYAGDGTALPTGHPLVLSVEAGPGHCGEQNVAFLTMAWPLDRPVAGPFMSARRTRVYVWQTSTGYPSRGLATTPGTAARLPSDARDTGLHRGSWHLWVSESELTTGVYLRSGSTIERWAYVSTFFGCA
jgi:hypothetical protein